MAEHSSVSQAEIDELHGRFDTVIVNLVHVHGDGEFIAADECRFVPSVGDCIRLFVGARPKGYFRVVERRWDVLSNKVEGRADSYMPMACTLLVEDIRLPESNGRSGR